MAPECVAGFHPQRAAAADPAARRFARPHDLVDRVTDRGLIPVSLRDYNRKRRFDRPTEPAGRAPGRWPFVRDPEARGQPSSLRFPPGARRRPQELGGSEGAESCDPAVKRLAMHVAEDHPVAYGVASRGSFRRGVRRGHGHGLG